jgi:hypothetical protein
LPAFLEAALKKEYAGKDPSIPYKIMNSKGYMHGNKTTAKGEALQAKHESDMRKKGRRAALAGM